MPDIAAVAGKELDGYRCIWRVVARAVWVMLVEGRFVDSRIAQRGYPRHLASIPSVFRQAFPAWAGPDGTAAGAGRG